MTNPSGTSGQSNQSQTQTEQVVNRIREDVRTLDKNSLLQVGREILKQGQTQGLTPTDFDIR